MKKILFLFLSSVVLLAATLPSFAQFTPEEIAERPKWEAFLRDAKIVGEKQITSEAVTKPWRLNLELEGVTRDALWKNATGRMGGYIEGWNYEIAAYLLDKYLEINMVPPTVEKEFHNSRGSCQLWMDAWITMKQYKEQKLKVPPIKVFYWNRALYVQRAFDNLIGNEDRHQNNYLITKDWRILLIDHSRTFRTTKKFTTQLYYGENNKEGLIMKQISRALLEKIKGLNYDIIKGIVGEYLDDSEINGVLARKDLIIQMVDNLVKKNGEENVIY
jgi:hypothetical protein